MYVHRTDEKEFWLTKFTIKNNSNFLLIFGNIQLFINYLNALSMQFNQKELFITAIIR